MSYTDRSYLTYQRNEEIVRVCMAIAENKYSLGETVSMSQVSKEASTKPSSRFWVSEDRAKSVVSSWLAHDNSGKPYLPYADPSTMHPLHMAMYKEIYERYKILRSKHPTWTHIRIIRRVVNSPAPSFYLTADSIKVYFYTHRKHEKEKSKANIQ